MASGQGSEYFMIDVPNGISQAEPGGTSLRNYLNVVAVRDCVGHLNNRGVGANKIVVLCFYEAQVRLIRQMINNSSDGSGGCREVCTVDSFANHDAPVVIVDFVVAERVERFSVHTSLADRPKANSFIQDSGRICCALTRGNDGLILVGQYALLVSWVFGGDRHRNPLFCMAEDLWTRRLISFDGDMVGSDTYMAFVERQIGYGRQRLGILNTT
ncbi:MAG: hypothetical protein Q9166_004012 [cf. Caloplaca sp. 2 TL-2023]